MSEQVRCTPTSSIGEIFLAHMCIRCMAIPTPHIISIIWSSHLWLSSFMWAFLTLFVFVLHHTSLFSILSVNSHDYAHPLHECSKYRTEVDHIDLYLASGLGTSQDKIPKKTKCETLVDWVLNKKKILVFPSPFLHENTIWRHSSHAQQELLHLYVIMLLVSMLI